MKWALFVVLATASTLSAGVPEKGGLPKGGLAPADDPLWNWFAGGGSGYLADNEIALWNGHFGLDLPWKIAGFDPAVFVEIGWAQFDNILGNIVGNNVAIVGQAPPAPRKGRAIVASLSADLEIVPVTLNGKLERPLFGPVNGYLGAGAGVAFLNVELSDGTTTRSDEEAVFFAQVFAGLSANLSPNVELFTGLRWIFLDQPGFRVAGLKFDLDDLGFGSDDVLLEAGGGLNF